MISLGDLILFNGSVPHKIDMIKGHGSQSDLGRMQMFVCQHILANQIKKVLLETYCLNFMEDLNTEDTAKAKV